jgi:acyl carrier protein
MTVPAILERVQALLKKRFELSDEQVLPHRELTGLGIDSLAAIEFVFELEDSFGISLSQERGDLNTVADIAALVEHAVSRSESHA